MWALCVIVGIFDALGLLLSMFIMICKPICTFVHHVHLYMCICTFLRYYNSICTNYSLTLLLGLQSCQVVAGVWMTWFVWLVHSALGLGLVPMSAGFDSPFILRGSMNFSLQA